MSKIIDTKYNPLIIEQGKYEFWLDNGYFKSGNTDKKPFSIVIPPPNVTGRLHLGHAWNSTLQDIIVRRKRMQGFDVLWLPGMDHAGIATQAKIEEKLKAEGRSRHSMGREAFLDIAWEWKAEYADHIRSQWGALGLSLDYDKERFTLDEQLNKAVVEAFIRMYEKGYIYRGERIINWDCEAKTALSNIEVEHKEINAHLYYFKYPFTDGSGFVEIATTRPETMFGDVAIMVNPDDHRFKSLNGKKVFIPGTERELPVIMDSYVDQSFGSGCVKVTPAHDPNDFEVGRRHHLPMPICMNEDGSMNHLAGKYEGMDRFECRKHLVKDLKNIGLLVKIENHVHAVGHSERTGVIVEPRLSKQWFIKMDELAETALKEHHVDFIPSRFEKIFSHWMESIQDWCISRQLWWGHRIPAYYKGDEIVVSATSPGEGWKQDNDVLDTWFSSALWPFSTMGWPEKTPDLERYYPNSVLVTAYDIIFFWVSRMIFQAIEFTSVSPFKEALIHGLIRDSQGRKMSKSLGNGVDPMDIKAQYGADTLRYFLTTNSSPGQDLRFEIEKVESSWNFINKLWNIARFVMLNLEEDADLTIRMHDLNTVDRWVLTRLNDVVKDVDHNYDKYEFGEVARTLYNFVWTEFASWYVEFAKVDLSDECTKRRETTQAVLAFVLKSVVKLLHPFMPFVTEEIYQNLPHDHDSIMIANWPILHPFEDRKAKENLDVVMSVITAVRLIRAEANLPNSTQLTLYIEVPDQETRHLLRRESEYIRRLGNPSDLFIEKSFTLEEEVVSSIQSKVTVYVPLKDVMDLDKEIERLRREGKALENEIKRAENMLSNDKFVNKAPVQKVDEERAKLSTYRHRYQATVKRLIELEKKL